MSSSVRSLSNGRSTRISLATEVTSTTRRAARSAAHFSYKLPTCPSSSTTPLLTETPIFVAQTLGSQRNSCSTLFLIVSAVFTRTPFLPVELSIMHRDPTAGSWLDHCRVEVQELCRIALRDGSLFCRCVMRADDPLCGHKPKICINRTRKF